MFPILSCGTQLCHIGSAHEKFEEAVNRRTGNTMGKRKRSQGQTTICKTWYRNLKINPTKTGGELKRRHLFPIMQQHALIHDLTFMRKMAGNLILSNSRYAVHSFVFLCSKFAFVLHFRYSICKKKHNSKRYSDLSTLLFSYSLKQNVALPLLCVTIINYKYWKEIVHEYHIYIHNSLEMPPVYADAVFQ